MWVNFAIIAVLVYGLWVGWTRGFILMGIDLIGFVLALGMAILLYPYLTPLIAHRFHVIQTLAGLVSYVLVLMVVELAYALVARQLLRRIPHRMSRNGFNHLAGSLLNGFKTLLLVTIFLIVLVSLPLTASERHTITDAAIPKTLLSYSGSLQGAINRTIGKDINDTLNFLTIKPESEESVDLGFKTTDVRLDESDERLMLTLVNHERTSRGLNALTMNGKARAVARDHSIDMFARGYFAHVTPEGKDPFQRMEDGGVKFGAAGENLALAPTLALAHQGLMNSPGHRANILSPDYRTVGIGIIDGGRYGLMITQDFTD